MSACVSFSSDFGGTSVPRVPRRSKREELSVQESESPQNTESCQRMEASSRSYPTVWHLRHPMSKNRASTSLTRTNRPPTFRHLRRHLRTTLLPLTLTDPDLLLQVQPLLSPALTPIRHRTPQTRRQCRPPSWGRFLCQTVHNPPTGQCPPSRPRAVPRQRHTMDMGPKELQALRLINSSNRLPPSLRSGPFLSSHPLQVRCTSTSHRHLPQVQPQPRWLLIRLHHQTPTPCHSLLKRRSTDRKRLVIPTQTRLRRPLERLALAHQLLLLLEAVDNTTLCHRLSPTFLHPPTRCNRLY